MWSSSRHVSVIEIKRRKLDFIHRLPIHRNIFSFFGILINCHNLIFNFLFSFKQALEEDVSVLTPKQEPYDIPLKKTKMDESQLTQYLRELYSPAQLLYQFSQLSRQQSPWSTNAASSPKHIIFGPNLASIPYLPPSQEPPILQNPERVVRHTENERFDRSYQPNVALAPRQTITLLAKEREEREQSERSNSVIKREIQIKQERPSTPNNESLESSRHHSPETTGVHENGVSATASAPPISPEGQSGSNEITSSTSPVPVSTSNLHHNHHHHNHQLPNKRESISPPSQQQSPTQRSHSTTTTLMKPSSVVVKLTTQQPLINGKIKAVPMIGNPEFELSTDTDEESLGEPDSSNHNGNLPQSLYEVVACLLKTNSSDDQVKILGIIKYMEKEITQLKEANKKEIRDRQQVEDALRKENERLQHQVRNNNVSSVIATASCHSSSSSSSSSLSDYERCERRNSIVEKPNVIIKPPKKSLLRITSHLLEDNKSTAMCNNSINGSATIQPSSIVIMPKCEDIINNNNTKAYNNNNNNNNNSTNTTTVINGNQTDGSSDEKQQQQHLQKTAIKAEKL